MSESEGGDFYEGHNYYAIYEEDDELNKEVLESIKSETPSKSIESKTQKKEDNGILKTLIRNVLQEFEKMRSRKTKIINPRFIKNTMRGTIKKVSDKEILTSLNIFLPNDISKIIKSYIEPEYWKCNYHSYGGTSDVYSRIINGEISFLLWVLTELDKNTALEKITTKEYRNFLKSLPLQSDGKKGSSRKDHNKRVKTDFCAVVASNDQEMSSFKTRIIITKECLLKIDDTNEIPIRLPCILGDITCGLDGTPWTMEQHKNIVDPFIKRWGKTKPLNKKYCNFEV